MLLKQKRAVSPIIATVLLVSLTIVLASIVFLQMRSFLQNQMEEEAELTQLACKGVAFDMDYNVSDSLKIIELQFTNRGNLPIVDFNIKLIGNGNSIIKSDNGFFVDVGMTSERKTISTEGFSQIVVYPIVNSSVPGKGNAKTVKCDNSGEVINL